MVSDNNHSFHPADYAAFAVIVLISITIGIYFALSGGRQRTTTEYLVAGRTMKFLPAAISFIVSFESSIMMLGTPAEAYVYGIQFWWLGVSWSTTMVLAAYMLIPMLYSLKLTSAYEYLECRFKSKAVRMIGTLLGILNSMFYMGIVLFGPAIAMEAVTGFPQWGSVFGIAVAAIIYTSIGGIKAVIWTDVFQALIMLLGILTIIIKGTVDSGGPSEVWHRAKNAGRLNLFNFDPDPTVRHTFWGLYFGSIFKGISLIFNQSSIQRISSTRSLKDAQRMMYVVNPSFAITSGLVLIEGVVAYAYYDFLRCDPLKSKQISDPNQIIPYMVMDIFRSIPGLPGLFLASLFSASLSTISSALSSLAAITWEDILKPCMPNASDLKATTFAKLSVIVYGLLSCGIALLIATVGGTLTQITGSLLGAFTGPLAGIFILGSFCPWANAKGTLLGAFLGSSFTCWVCLGSTFSKTRKRAPWLPSAPIEKCPVQNTTLHSLFTVDSSIFATMSSPFTAYNTTSNIMYQTPTASDMEANGPKGIDALYSLSYTWYFLVGTVSVVLLGSLFSIVTGANKKDPVDPKYLVPVSDLCCCCLPERIRNFFQCGVNYDKVKAKEGDEKYEIEDPSPENEIPLMQNTDNGRSGKVVLENETDFSTNGKQSIYQ